MGPEGQVGLDEGLCLRVHSDVRATPPRLTLANDLFHFMGWSRHTDRTPRTKRKRRLLKVGRSRNLESRADETGRLRASYPTQRDKGSTPVCRESPVHVERVTVDRSLQNPYPGTRQRVYETRRPIFLPTIPRGAPPNRPVRPCDCPLRPPETLLHVPRPPTTPTNTVRETPWSPLFLLLPLTSFPSSTSVPWWGPSKVLAAGVDTDGGGARHLVVQGRAGFGGETETRVEIGRNLWNDSATRTEGAGEG